MPDWRSDLVNRYSVFVSVGGEGKGVFGRFARRNNEDQFQGESRIKTKNVKCKKRIAVKTSGRQANEPVGRIDPPEKALLCAILRCLWAFFAGMQIKVLKSEDLFDGLSPATFPIAITFGLFRDYG